jgi:hypothetical protein
MITLLMSLLVSAFAQNSCFCETGIRPTNEIKYFKLGCQIWLSKQANCTNSEIVPTGTSYIDRGNASTSGQVIIGYVGHWTSASELVDYLKKTVKPLLDSGLSVDIDNTACLSMDQPEKVLSYVESLRLPSGQELKIKGNQANSIGEWESLIGSGYNFWAKVASNQNEVEFPSCDDFEHYACLEKYQLNHHGRCWDATGNLIQLSCCRVAAESEIEPAFYQWEQKQNCF